MYSPAKNKWEKKDIIKTPHNTDSPIYVFFFLSIETQTPDIAAALRTFSSF